MTDGVMSTKKVDPVKLAKLIKLVGMLMRAKCTCFGEPNRFLGSIMPLG